MSGTMEDKFEKALDIYSKRKKEDENGSCEVEMLEPDHHSSRELTTVPQEADKAEKELNSDTEFVRVKLRHALNIGADVLEDSRRIAVETGDPNAYMAFSKVLKEVTNSANTLIEVSRKKAETKKIKSETLTEKIKENQRVNKEALSGTLQQILNKAKEMNNSKKE